MLMCMTHTILLIGIALEAFTTLCDSYLVEEILDRKKLFQVVIYFFNKNSTLVGLLMYTSLLSLMMFYFWITLVIRFGESMTINE